MAIYSRRKSSKFRTGLTLVKLQRLIFWVMPCLFGAGLVAASLLIEDPKRRLWISIGIAASFLVVDLFLVAFLLANKDKLRAKDSQKDGQSLPSGPTLWQKLGLGTFERNLVALMIAIIGGLMVTWGENMTQLCFGEGFEGGWAEALELDGVFHESNSWYRFTYTPVGMVVRIAGALILLLAFWVMPPRERKAKS